jgi:hypothetical protein
VGQSRAAAAAAEHLVDRRRYSAGRRSEAIVGKSNTARCKQRIFQRKSSTDLERNEIDKILSSANPATVSVDDIRRH